MSLKIIRLILVPLPLVVLLAACVETPAAGGGGSRILAMGDSMMAWNSNSGRGIADAVEVELDEEVVDRAIPGAWVTSGGPFGLKVGRQFVDGNWDWVVVNGGGNDLWLGCGCGACVEMLERLVSADGSQGAVPDLVADLRATGARVVYMGYLRTPGFSSPVEHCGAIGDRFDARLAAMARRDPGVFFIANSDIVPPGDRSFHAADRVHPSVKGSAVIGARVARVIRRNGG